MRHWHIPPHSHVSSIWKHSIKCTSGQRMCHARRCHRRRVHSAMPANPRLPVQPCIRFLRTEDGRPKTCSGAARFSASHIRPVNLPVAGGLGGTLLLALLLAAALPLLLLCGALLPLLLQSIVDVAATKLQNDRGRAPGQPFGLPGLASSFASRPCFRTLGQHAAATAAHNACTPTIGARWLRALQLVSRASHT